MSGVNMYRAPVGANLLAICLENGLHGDTHRSGESPDYSYWAELGGASSFSPAPESLGRSPAAAGRG